MPSGPFTVEALGFGVGFPEGAVDVDGPVDGDVLTASCVGSADAVAVGAPVAGRAAEWSFLDPSDPHAVRASIEETSTATMVLRRDTLGTPHVDDEP
ncbi:hypothetical protein AB0H83_38685 [Dactylosporangium sp. NPDC050688]|uniref:hypothetical protein n=1 Tax=Dactylosporangium sp. NPDC050688 TaxID=3157217 RepID=UPI0033DCCA47